jgi:hypothetical protein
MSGDDPYTVPPKEVDTRNNLKRSETMQRDIEIAGAGQPSNGATYHDEDYATEELGNIDESAYPSASQSIKAKASLFCSSSV